MEDDGFSTSVDFEKTPYFEPEDQIYESDGSEQSGFKLLPEFDMLVLLKAAVDPFIEFLELFTSVYKQQDLMTENLEEKKRKLDKKLGKMKWWQLQSSPACSDSSGCGSHCSFRDNGEMARLDFEEAHDGFKREKGDNLFNVYWTVIKKMDVDRFRIEIEALLESVDLAMREEG
ncbi:Hypothetical predicted protein [Olea europaea subsp. europaea]|uniref:Uncharacterized protein n=1 Tax=Olea europaea subsp. europaea TaxID=158383 RepID=A0A8S0SSL4_OLEEU|nr:Hypothetical predicted protein [Olea europaea subsp. europaea]